MRTWCAAHHTRQTVQDFLGQGARPTPQMSGPHSPSLCDTAIGQDAYSDDEVACAVHHSGGALYGPVSEDGCQTPESDQPASQDAVTGSSDFQMLSGLPTEPFQPAPAAGVPFRTEQEISAGCETAGGVIEDWLPTGVPESRLRELYKTVALPHGFHVIVQSAHAATFGRGKTLRAICHRHKNPTSSTSNGRRMNRTHGTGCKWRLVYEESRSGNMVVRNAFLTHNHPLFDVDDNGRPAGNALAFARLRAIPEQLASIGDVLKIARRGPAVIDSILVDNAHARGMAVTWTYKDVHNRCISMGQGRCFTDCLCHAVALHVIVHTVQFT